MIRETAKILDSNIKITSITVRVPLSATQSESLNIETEKLFEIDQIKNLMEDSPGILLEDEPKKTFILSHLMP
ncbi:Asd/ArgC dimerization domain-containing protein [Deltaproteobacteria bacterium]|nr:Asd/ArgC dimerization domain-containing protein [Deltaproteobacteria bacterium]